MAFPARYCRHCAQPLRSLAKTFGIQEARQSSTRSFSSRASSAATLPIRSQQSPTKVGLSKSSAFPPRSLETPRLQFSTTRPTREAIINPRQDDDGNPMEVEITPRAANRLAQIMKTDSNPNLALRVTVESGGCHGFQYLMSLTNVSTIDQEEDTVFQGRDGAKLVMDQPSLELLKGSKVDYTMELIGSQFKIVDNPLATSSCGCGTSFDIKA